MMMFLCPSVFVRRVVFAVFAELANCYAYGLVEKVPLIIG